MSSTDDARRASDFAKPAPAREAERSNVFPQGDRGFGSISNLSVSSVPGIQSYASGPSTRLPSIPSMNIPGPRHYAPNGQPTPPDSRRSSDDPELSRPLFEHPRPHIEPPRPPFDGRQSLPSIHEALQDSSNPNMPRSPRSSFNFNCPPPSSIGRAYSMSEAPAYGPQARQPTPPRQMQGPPPPHHQVDQRPMPDDSRRSSCQGPAPSSHAPRFSDPRYGPDPRASERVNECPQPPQHAPPPPPPQHDAYVYRPPQGPIPASYHPAPFEPQRHARDCNTGIKSEVKPGAPNFQERLQGQMNIYDVESSLARIHAGAAHIAEWSANYYNVAAEQQRHPPPGRTPDLRSIDEMLEQNRLVADCLLRLRDSIISDQSYQMREQGQMGKEYAEQQMHNGDPRSRRPSGPDSKKRRGRAAPPGRCHSCQRAETPEWRRGPDGARTLCNACGLHYAKISRKTEAIRKAALAALAAGITLPPSSLNDVIRTMSDGGTSPRTTK